MIANERQAKYRGTLAGPHLSTWVPQWNRLGRAHGFKWRLQMPW